MAYLQFEINKKVCIETKEEFVKQIQEAYSEVMDIEKDNIAILLRENEKYNLTIGRSNPKDDICFMNLDIADVNAIEKRRELAVRFREIVKVNFQVNETNQYITFTLHKEEGLYLA